MTALKKYERLESLGLWRAHLTSEPREVIVSFGNATLVMTDLHERPLQHWSLVGMQIIGEDEAGVVYSMTDDGDESLVIRDAVMNKAIAEVARGTVQVAPKSRDQRGNGAGWIWIVIFALLLLGLGAGVPLGARALATRMMPPEQAQEVGQRMALLLMEGRGAPCRSTAGTRVLDGLAERIDPDSNARVRVLALGAAPVAAMPGHTILLDRTAIETAASADEVAGLVALGLAAEPIARFFEASGPLAGFRYISSGRIADASLHRAANAALALPKEAQVERAAALLRRAGLDAGSLETALTRAGAPRQAMASGEIDGTSAFSDVEWRAVQAICAD